MSKDIKKDVLEKIKKEEIKPRPKSLFQIFKALTVVILTFLILASIYLFNLSFYLPNRGVNSGRIIKPIVFDSIPWGLVIIASVLIGLTIFIYNRYEGGYKKNILWTIIIISAIAILGGGAISASRFNERLEHRPGFNRMYGNFEERFVPGRGRRMNLEKTPLNLQKRPNLKYFN